MTLNELRNNLPSQIDRVIEEEFKRRETLEEEFKLKKFNILFSEAK